MLDQNILVNRPVLPTDASDQYSADWQSVLADAVRDQDELRRLAGIAVGANGQSAPANPFGTLVPRTFLARVRPGDPHDPLLLQVMPQPAENLDCEGFSVDPLCESAAVTPCLLQKYKGRSLILTTAACGVHCRYCFRRHYPRHDVGGNRPIVERLMAAIGYIEHESSIHEVILSGGDPLTIEDESLEQLIHRLADIEHLRRLRLHSRMPIVIPQRVTDGLLELLKKTRLTASMVVQSNHPSELNTEVEVALALLIDAGVPLLCQSVLLAGVNDNIEVLAGLYERLIDCRVTPYYLHQLDRVTGAAHFEVPQQRGLKLIQKLRELLPGYAVPRYVREVPGAAHKKVLG
ncbi:MAG: EF-P beta-lysylation protein EpmB [Pirellulales bacterium]|nr:EF-P beta-lysylation protein EpmB [Pirellulales bacterium]